MKVQKKIEGINWEVQEEFAGVLVEEIMPCIRKFNEVINSQGFAFARNSKLSSSKRYLFYPTSQGDVFIKRYCRYKPVIHVRSIYRKLLKVHHCTDRAGREWRNLNRVFWKGGPTPEPLAVGRKVEFTSFPYVKFESYIVCRRLNGFVHLPSYIADLASNSSHKILYFRRMLAKQLAKLIASLHERGVFHRDLNPRNFLIKEGEELELKIVDLENVRFEGANNPGETVLFPLGKMAGGFIRLGEAVGQPVSKVDRFRFLKEYARLRAFDYKSGQASKIEDYAKVWMAKRSKVSTYSFAPQPP